MSNVHLVYPNADTALPDLMHRLLTADEVGSRNGRVRELTHVSLALKNPWQREITVPGRKANLAAQIAETMWVLAGRNDIGFLSHYLPRAADFSDDGETWRGGYGPRLRAWENRLEPDASGAAWSTIDQLAHVVDMLKRDALTRRAVIAIYNPGVDTAEGKDIPCNDFITFTNRLGKLEMSVTIRSNDLMWGWSGINAFEWSALHEIIANLVGVHQGTLHFNTASLHLYQQHWAKAQRLLGEQGTQGLEDSPRFAPLRAVNQKPESVLSIEHLDWLIKEWFNLEREIREGDRAMAAVGVEEFPEPMMQSWLRVIQWWWTGNHRYLKPLAGTRLEYATHVSLQPKSKVIGTVSSVEAAPSGVSIVGKLLGSAASGTAPRGGLRYGAQTSSDFIRFAVKTHDEKHAAYGDSWKRRGEMLGIMANIARKIDRLGASETSDETSADTAMDLMVYLAKYRCWIFDETLGSRNSDNTGWVNNLLLVVDKRSRDGVLQPSQAEQEEWLRNAFDRLEKIVSGDREQSKGELVDLMLDRAYELARYLWDTSPRPYDPINGDGVDEYRGADHE